MRRRELLACTAAQLAWFRNSLQAADPTRNIRWAVSMFLWTSTQWREDGSARFTDMLDVIKDTGFDGFRLTGWPKSLETYGMQPAVLERELSKRGLRLATLSFGGQADDPAQHAAIEKSAREACKLLRDFGTDLLTVFSPRRVNKVLEREHIRRACEFWNRLGGICGEMGVRAGSHNHSQGQLIESQDEIELMLKLTDPKLFNWSPDTVHLYMAGCDIVGLIGKHAKRLISMDLVDAKYQYATEDLKVPNGKVEAAGSHNATFMLGNRDYGDGEVDLQGIMRILKRVQFKGWITIDHHYSRVSPRQSFTRCRQYIREKLDPIYA